MLSNLLSNMLSDMSILLSGLSNMFYGLLNLSWWGYIIATLILTHITIVSVTVFLHRHQAHRGLDLHPIVSHFFRFWLWLTTGMITKAWAAIHRKHHANCETEKDPHSPQVLGLPLVLLEGAELYKREAENRETLERYGQGTPNDWLERNVYSRHSAKGLFLGLAIDLVLFGVPGLTIWAIQCMWIPFFAAGVINGIGHYWGYRNFESKDAATNISPWGILIGGEELHNNHHAYPSSAKLSIKWWEFDIGWLYISILSHLGLAKVKRVAPKPEIIPGKMQIDADTLRAIITNRIQIMSAYSKSVILPIFKQEKSDLLKQESGDYKVTPSILKRMKTALIRESSLVQDSDKRLLEQFLENERGLRIVYHFRRELQEIWDRTAASQKELLDALHEWCQRAEMSGIQKLQDFVLYLKGYTLRAV